MGTRRERVILDLEDNMTPGLARAAITSRVVSGELDKLGKDVDRTGESTNRAGRDIDRFSGRLRAAADAALILGPALVPLGAGTIPLLAGAVASLGAAGLGLGVTVAALNGVGDALKVLNDYELDRTPENLAKVREEFRKLGPDGAHFVQFLNDLEPQLRELQQLARQGALPGFEAGISNAMELLPRLRVLILDVSTALGDLADDAGDALAGEEFRPFFDYLRTDAAPTLDEFSRTMGNFALAFGNLMVGLAPATRDFTGGLLEFSQGLVEASQNLDDSQGFQDFLDYVRVNGPRAVDFLGSLGSAFLAIVEASAPVGATVLPILTQLLDLVGMLAQSDLGTPLLAGAAGLTAFSRAGKIMEGTTLARLGRGLRTYVHDLTAVTTAQERARTSASGLTAQQRAFQQTLSSVGRGVQLFALLEVLPRIQEAVNDLMNVRLDESNLVRNLDALANGEIVDNLDHIGENVRALNAAFLGTFDKIVSPLPGKTASDIAEEEVTKIDQALAGLVESGNADRAAAAFQEILKQTDALGISREDVTNTFGAYSTALDNATNSAEATARAEEQHSAATRKSYNALREEAAALRASTEAMRAKREEARSAFDAETRWGRALLDARKEAREGRKTLDENTRAGQANREALSELAAAWANQSEAVKASKARYADARQAFVDTAVQMGATKAEAKALADQMLELPTQKKIPVTVETEQAMAGIRAIENGLNDLHDKTVKITTVHVNGHAASTVEPHASVPRRGRTAGRGSAGDISDMLGPGLASRGTVEDPFTGLLYSSRGVINGLRGLQGALHDSEDALDKERSKRDRLRAKRDQVRGDVFSDLSGDLFATGSNVWAAGSGMDPAQALADRKDRARRWIAAIKALKRKGLTGNALAEIVGDGLEAAEYVASQTDAYVNQFANDYAQAQALTAQAANLAGNVSFGADLSATNKELRELRQEVREVKQAIKQEGREHRKNADKNAEHTGKRVGQEINGAARVGMKRGKR